MSKNRIGRRTFLKGAGLAALSAAGVVQSEESHAQVVVPNARVADYRLLQRRIGTTRSVVVTPAPYPA